MKKLRGKKVLLFCPTFFSYENHIKTAIEACGATVFRYDDRPSNDFFTKALLRIDKRILSKKVDSYYRQIVDSLQANRNEIHYVLFVNPEAVTTSILNRIKTVFNNATFILYMWDSFKNKINTKEILPFFHRKFTFDPADAEEFKMQLRPLFYIDAYSPENEEVKYDLLFIGTAHSDRYQLVKKIISEMGGSITMRSCFFLNSRALFLANKVRSRAFRKIKYRDLSFKALSHSDNARFMAKSKAILDINHPKQIGLTMRTFEAIGVQRKLITTNKDIKRYDFYNENNILIIDRDQPKISKSFFVTSFVQYSPEILFKYSIKGWVSDIFESDSAE